MNWRLKTKQELIEEYGDSWNTRKNGISNRMTEYLGMDIDPDIYDNIDFNVPSWNFDAFDYMWRVWQITKSVPMINKLFSSKLTNIFIKNNSRLSKSLLGLKNSVREINDIKNISILNDAIVKFSPSGKESIVDSSGKWLNQGRQRSRAGRVFTKLCKEFNIEFTHKEMEDLINFTKAILSGGEFILVEGQDIKKYYHVDSYDKVDNLGSLSSSCMRHDKNAHMFDMYINNPDVCKMLILKEATGRIKGRALLWVTDKGLFLDRIYGSDSIIEKFNAYAEDNKWMRKSRQSCDSKIGVFINGEHKDLVLEVDLKFPNTALPYLDTFTYVDLDMKLSNKYANASYGILDRTDGSIYRTFKCVVDNQIRNYDEGVKTYDENGNEVFAYRGNLIVCNLDGLYYLPYLVVNTRSNGYVNKKNNESKLIYVESDECWELKRETFTCQYDNVTYCISSANRWSEPSRMVRIKIKSEDVILLKSNVNPFLEKLNYIIIGDTVISPSLSRKLNIT